MSKLWFQNHKGQERVIADCPTWESVTSEIFKFVEDCNAAKPSDKQFHIYYIRYWEEDGRTEIDVGSWDEFFFWEGTVPFVEKGNYGEDILDYE